MKAEDFIPGPDAVWPPDVNVEDEILDVVDGTVDLFNMQIAAAAEALKSVRRETPDHGVRKSELMIATSRARGAVMIFNELKDLDAGTDMMRDALYELFSQSCEIATQCATPENNEVLSLPARCAEIEIVEGLVDLSILLFEPIRLRAPDLRKTIEAMTVLWRNCTAIAGDTLSKGVTEVVTRLDRVRECQLSERAVEISLRLQKMLLPLVWRASNPS
jgi:hypothetical protein